MDASNWAIGLALLAGSVRAVELWRAAPKVDVVNVVVLGALVEGRSRELDVLLRKVGSSPYFDLARAIAAQADERLDADNRTVRRELERHALVALAAANRALRRFAWLDAITLVSLAFAGIAAAVNQQASPVLALELLAATLLWIANVRGVRSIATRMYAGATALVDGIADSRHLIVKSLKEKPIS